MVEVWGNCPLFVAGVSSPCAVFCVLGPRSPLAEALTESCLVDAAADAEALIPGEVACGLALDLQWSDTNFVVVT